MLFSELSLHADTIVAINKLGFTAPTPIQSQAIPPALEGKDLIASAETGSGKTAAYLIPVIDALHRKPDTAALVLAPTRELVVQIANTAREMSVEMRVATVIGGGSYMRQERDLKRSPRIIVATPGRLVDHLGRFKGLFAKMTMVVLDEADRMLEMGFTQPLREIRSRLPGKPQALLFSATFPSDVAVIAREWLKDPVRVTIGSTAKPAQKITQTHAKVPGEHKNGELLKEVRERTGSILVFARTKRRVDKVVDFLRDNDVLAARIHGGCRQRERDNAISSFRAEKFKVLVATDIAARGLDIPHIDHVINYDLPVVAEDYLHRIGRTGRAGRAGSSHCLVGGDEHSHWRRIERLMSSESLPSSKELYQMRAGKDSFPRERRERGFGDREVRISASDSTLTVSHSEGGEQTPAVESQGFEKRERPRRNFGDRGGFGGNRDGRGFKRGGFGGGFGGGGRRFGRRDDNSDAPRDFNKESGEGQGSSDRQGSSERGEGRFQRRDRPERGGFGRSRGFGGEKRGFGGNRGFGEKRGFGGGRGGPRGGFRGGFRGDRSERPFNAEGAEQKPREEGFVTNNDTTSSERPRREGRFNSRDGEFRGNSGGDRGGRRPFGNKRFGDRDSGGFGSGGRRKSFGGPRGGFKRSAPKRRGEVKWKEKPEN
jgi:ATP-dependent RNA helicase DeaD